MDIRVKDIINLIYGCHVVQIWIDGDTYEFPTYELPKELDDMVVETIDDPYNYSAVGPLCINLLKGTNFDDYEEFKETNKEYLI